MTINSINALSKTKDSLLSYEEQRDTQELLSLWNTNNFQAGQKLMGNMPLQHHYDTQIKKRGGIALIVSILTEKQLSKHRDFSFESLDPNQAAQSMKKIMKVLDKWEQSLGTHPNENSEKKSVVIKDLKQLLRAQHSGSPQQNLKDFYFQFNSKRKILTHNASTKEVNFIYQLISILITLYKNYQDHRRVNNMNEVIKKTISNHYKIGMFDPKSKNEQKELKLNNIPKST